MPTTNIKPPKMTARQALERLLVGSATEVVRERDNGRVTYYRKASSGEALWESSVDGGATWQPGEVRLPREGDYFVAREYKAYREFLENGPRIEEMRRDLSSRLSPSLSSRDVNGIADFVEKHTRG